MGQVKMKGNKMVKIFFGQDVGSLENRANNFEKHNNFKIVSANLTVKCYEHLSSDFYLTVVYEKEDKNEKRE